MKSDLIDLYSSIFGECFIKEKNNILFFCPKYNHHKPKLSISISKHLFQCWVCGYHGQTISLIKKYGTKNQVEYLKKLIGTTSRTLYDNNKNVVVKMPKSYKLLCSSSNFLLKEKVISYLNSRYIDEHIIKRYSIGVVLNGFYEDRIIFPSYSAEGKLNYFVGRAIHKGRKPKYLNANISKNNMIFNELFINFKKPVILTEGIFDALRIENTIPLLGSSLNEETVLFKRLVKYKPIVYLALDSDAIIRMNSIAKVLKQWMIKVRILDITPYKDLSEIPSKDLLCIINSTKEADFQYFIESELFNSKRSTMFV